MDWVDDESMYFILMVIVMMSDDDEIECDDEVQITIVTHSE